MTSEGGKSALLAGATGLTGGHLLDFLLNDQRYERIISLVRKPTDIRHEKLNEVSVNFDELSRFAQYFGVDEIYCCLGTTIKKVGSKESFRRVDLAYPVELARLGKQKGARSFVIVTSLGANRHSGNFYLRTKGEVEERLRNLNYERLVIVRPSVLLGSRGEFRFLESLGIKLLQILGFLLVGPLRKYRAIEARKVAWCMVELANTASASATIVESDEVEASYAGQAV